MTRQPTNLGRAAVPQHNSVDGEVRVGLGGMDGDGGLAPLAVLAQGARKRLGLGVLLEPVHLQLVVALEHLLSLRVKTCSIERLKIKIRHS